jgi:hypothetical protein
MSVHLREFAVTPSGSGHAPRQVAVVVADLFPISCAQLRASKCANVPITHFTLSAPKHGHATACNKCPNHRRAGHCAKCEISLFFADIMRKCATTTLQPNATCRGGDTPPSSLCDSSSLTRPASEIGVTLAWRLAAVAAWING